MSPPLRQRFDHARGRQARAKLLVRIAEHIDETGKEPTFRWLQEFLGAKSPQGARFHLERLAEDGLVTLSPLSVTTAGLVLIDYFNDLNVKPSVFERLVTERLGGFSPQILRAFNECAKELDGKYAVEREGLHRVERWGSKELERKVTTERLLHCLRQCPSIELAAKRAGISDGAVRRRFGLLCERVAAQRLEMVPVHQLATGIKDGGCVWLRGAVESEIIAGTGYEDRKRGRCNE